MTDETLEITNAFIKERYDFFVENVFPKIQDIMDAVANSKQFRAYHRKSYGNYKFKMNGIKFKFELQSYKGDKGVRLIDYYDLFMSYKWKKIIHVFYKKDASEKISLYKFHECDWINKLDSIPAQIQEKQAALFKKEVDKMYKKACKDYGKRCK